MNSSIGFWLDTDSGVIFESIEDLQVNTLTTLRLFAKNGEERYETVEIKGAFRKEDRDKLIMRLPPKVRALYESSAIGARAKLWYAERIATGEETVQ